MPFSTSSSGSGILTSQTLTSSGSVLNWGSVVTITSATTSNITLPQATIGDIGKTIIITNNGTGLVTTIAFSGDTLQNSRNLAQGEAITITVISINLSRVVSDTVATPIITESLPLWVASTAVNQSAQRATTILGVLTGLSSNATRTTTATFNAIEGAFWTYLSQSSVPAFTASSLVLAGFQIIDSGQTFQSNTTRVTGLVFDTAEQVNWTALSSSSTGTRISLSNFTANSSIGIASATVDSATIIAFVQTTTGITVTIPSPTNVNVHKTISVENLTTSTQPITVKGFTGATDIITLGIGDVKEISWNGNGWRATSSANVLGEGVSPIYAPSFTTLTGTNSSSGTDIVSITIPSSGTWVIQWNMRGVNTGISNVGSSSALYDNSNVLQPNSEVNSIFNSASSSNTQATSYNSYTVITTGVQTFKIKGWSNPVAGGLIISDLNGRSWVSARKVSGFIPVMGQTVDYISSTASATSPVGIVDVTWNTFTGNITNTGTLFTLLAGKTYRLQASLGINFNTGSGVNATYQFVDTSNISIGANIAIVYNAVASSTGDSAMGVTGVTYTALVDTQVKVRILSSGAVSGATINRANLSITQIGSTATTTTARAIVITNNTSGQSIPNSSTTNIIGWTTVKDTTNSFTAAGVFTAPRTSEYQLSYSLNYNSFTPTASGMMSAEILGSALRGSYLPVVLSQVITDMSIVLNCVVSLVAGQTISLASSNTTGAARTLNIGASRNFVSIVEITPTY